MIDMKFLRENPEAVKENIRKKFQEDKLPLVDRVLTLDKENRETIQAAQDLRTQRNAPGVPTSGQPRRATPRKAIAQHVAP